MTRRGETAWRRGACFHTSPPSRRTRRRRRTSRRQREAMGTSILGVVTMLAALAVLLIGQALSPEADPTPARERAARMTAQERYYEVLDRYGDLEGAVEAARIAYEVAREEE